MANPAATTATLNPPKFRHPDITARGEKRASVGLVGLRTLWFNTGTLCNVTCANCYIESSPRNDRLIYLSPAEVAAFLDEIEQLGLPTEEIGFTGGEPFMNRGIVAMLKDALSRGFRVLLLTNAMRPMMRWQEPLLELNGRYGERLTVRVSIDHYGKSIHEQERGKNTWEPMIQGLCWLARNGFNLHVAGRRLSGESEAALRAGYGRLFAQHGISIDAADPVGLTLFPEMDETQDVPEITEQCWGILNIHPDSMMCATSRMIVKRREAERPSVISCTLLPYDKQFEMGDTLASSAHTVKLNHPHCARFCVLGGASCSRG
jgi:uncharacterized Fe-S cluster-containing radical SAM superfamily protein